MTPFLSFSSSLIYLNSNVSFLTSLFFKKRSIFILLYDSVLVLSNKNKESLFVDPVMDMAHMDTANTHTYTDKHTWTQHAWNHHSPTDLFLCFRESHKDFRSYSTNSWKCAWAHTACRFWCFPNFHGVKVNNLIVRNLRQAGVFRGHVAGKFMAVCQMLYHSGCPHANYTTVSRKSYSPTSLNGCGL